jgi:HAD superfamily hydrolase (TIGR01549 family)
MFYKGIIFDLDNTLYDYDLCHNKAINEVFNYLIKSFRVSLDKEYIKSLYDDISKKIKYELKNTASCHNKSIYFKQLLEKLNIEFSHFQIINNLYWDSFYENLVCFDGVHDFIIWNKNIGKKIGILTDYETEYQVVKLEKLGLLKYIDIVVTSEEVGIEKPSYKMFYTMLQKMNLNPGDVIMIGDNYDKDITGAINSNILGYWFNKNNQNCNNFIDLHSQFVYILNELDKLKKISKYCGERFDLVQAGGGNTSVKINDLMFIKASGYNLTNIDENNGYTVINNKLLLEDINANVTKDVMEYNFIGNKRGSIETFMHSILKKYTVHLHPIQINRILVSKKAIEIINEVYPNSLIIEYLTPGIKVCNKIKEKYNDENIIFLLNHGIIVTSDDINQIYNLINDVLIKFESYQEINFDNYKNTNIISNALNTVFKVSNVSYLCQDEVINKYFNQNMDLFKQSISFPDALIYCGVKYLFGLENIDHYKSLYDEYPKIIIENGLIFINSHSLTKCKEIEDVLKSNLIILDSTIEKNYLSSDEICFLNNWDAEKYRKLL